MKKISLILLALIFVAQGVVFAGPVHVEHWNVNVKGEFTHTPKYRAENSSGYSYIHKIDDGGFSEAGVDSGKGMLSGGAADKTYGIGILLARPSTAAASGDSNDAGLKIDVRNFAENDANYILRAINASCSSRSGGVLGLLDNTIGAHNRSGSTVSYVRALQITAENYGTVSTEFGGLDIRLLNEAAVATTEYGIRLQNLNASIADAVGTAIIISDSGVNTGWDIGLDMSGAQINSYDIILGGGTSIYESATAGLVMVPAGRGSATYSSTLWIDDGGNKDTPLVGSMTGGAAEKTYGIFLELNRPSTSDGSGDSVDALYKGVYTNHGQNDTAFIARGIDVAASNRAGGTLNRIENSLNATNRGSGCNYITGLIVTAANYGSDTTVTEFGGLDIRLQNEAYEATTGFGLRIQNLNNSIAGDMDSAILIADSGVNTGFTDGINMTGATINQAQLVFSNGSKLFVGAQTGENNVYGEVGAYDAVGSVYFATNGKIFVQVADNGATADWETVTSASAE